MRRFRQMCRFQQIMRRLFSQWCRPIDTAVKRELEVVRTSSITSTSYSRGTNMDAIDTASFPVATRKPGVMNQIPLGELKLRRQLSWSRPVGIH
jgi:hypothetical protein